ncbi:DUF664 domain-containing protein [Streptomyces griseiscabiei]|uniref:DUF664 domain-containing protein n=1 Tax=Streptomyces griseiscabiei TaxID=2993540 RepID=A0ABU4LH79_9ACTN|nr:DUF664 domain-containing protein [Streptomyces griseiscabiei]MBZ3907982.1 DUF664 domain-containing protein [Streptomyces griseiscabiei]MDX2915131.1 DUF664 domain-containing protein [Streptomyces griseiscabiei]
MERGWAAFIVDGPSTMPDFTELTEADWAKRADEFRMLPGETLTGVLAEYAEVSDRTDALVATLPDLNASRARPPSTPVTRTSSAKPWTVRRAWAEPPGR